jgi:hypothetical protein
MLCLRQHSLAAACITFQDWFFRAVASSLSCKDYILGLYDCIMDVLDSSVYTLLN